MENKVRSGKELLDDFFNSLHKLEGVDSDIVSMLIELYDEDKLTDTNLKNGLQNLRENDEENKN